MGYILLADDDQISQELIQEAFELHGFVVKAADNGVDALKLALDCKPALLLLDVMMPKKSGLEVTRVVKSHYARAAPPVILISALGSVADIEQGRISGADDYIIKPFSPEDLLNKIQTALNQDYSS